MLADEVRAPWWQWVLVSLAGSVVMFVLLLGLAIALLFQGVDLTDYVYLKYPPFITSGLTAACLGLFLAAQTGIPLLALLLFRPARVVVFGTLGRVSSPGALMLRLGAGVVFSAGVQAAWTALAPPAPEQAQLVDHLLYAVVHGGQVWPILWMTVAIGLVAPLVEEMLFRGLVFRLLARRWSFLAGAALSAAAFGLAHGLATALPTGLLGLYFAYQTHRDGHLAGAVTLHALNNLAVVFLTFWQLAG